MAFWLGARLNVGRKAALLSLNGPVLVLYSGGIAGVLNIFVVFDTSINGAFGLNGKYSIVVACKS